LPNTGLSARRSDEREYICGLGSQRTVSIADAQGDGAGRLSTVEGSDEATFDATRAISATVMAVDPHGPAIEIVAFPPGEPASPLGTVRLRVLAESDATPGSLVVRA